ncbi:hypothetical protein ONZ51_g11855 [Trametes cubensis]|uniref:O-methylsterigmatocystin oxidoreductase n=1 Tax=Trametes cubensis TaxID=1111947 RepID=A0AAD7THQ4_9APHY|nr:hypothetical protein ONZ51_g11855 [Trametes cubensis]
MFSTVAMKVVYGVDLQGETDKRIDIIASIFKAARNMTVAAQLLLEYFPSLAHLPAWMPGGSFVQQYRDGQEPNKHIVETEFAEAKARVESGQDTSSVVAKLLARIAQTGDDGEEEEKEIAKDVAAVAVEASADTSFATLDAFFLAMALHPEVQARARAELDAIVGPHRLPDYSDREQLVYINAIMKESLRWHNTFPLAISHRTIADATLRGYFIPAGTTVIPNVWACMHDPETFPEPERFIPDRFVRDGKLDPDVLDPASLVFGFGRRVCPGRHFADAMLFMTIASVLHVFEVGPPLDDEGRPIELSYRATHGFLSYPEVSACTVRPRSVDAKELILTSRRVGLNSELQDL